MDFPSPLQLLLAPVSLIVIGLYTSLYAWETMFPRNKNLPKIRYAALRGFIGFFVFFYLSSYLPLLTDGFLSRYQLMDLSALPLFVQVLTGLLCYQLVLYAWHRSMHRSNVLWRIFHQMHHSSERIDIPSTFYFSPMDMIGFTLVSSFVFALVMGVSAPAITAIILSLNFFSIFQHANIRTPRWLGYFVQRPEQHGLHHQKGVHRYNYADLPIYDLLFGTFHNPKHFEEETGFYNGASSRIADMLLCRDVSSEKK